MFLSLIYEEKDGEGDYDDDTDDDDDDDDDQNTGWGPQICIIFQTPPLRINGTSSPSNKS